MTARALTKDEADKEAKGWRDDKDIEGRWLAFKLTEELAKDTSVTVSFPAGFPSAEGPRKTEREQSFSFKTYGLFKVREARCGWRNECYPGMPFEIEFTNPVDEDALDPKQISVDPAIVGFEADVSWHSLNLRGLTKGKTTYTVKLDKGLKDIYGQTLGDSEELKWRVGPSRALLMGNVQQLTVLDPIAKKRRLPVYTMNMKEVAVELYKVTPRDWRAYLDFLQERWRDDAPKTPPGKNVFSKTIETGAPEEELFELGVDLSPALDGDFGQVIAIIKPTKFENKWERDRMTIITWVQATRIGLDAFSDPGDLTAWATNLADGKPLEGATVTLTPPGTVATTDARGLATLSLPASAGTQILTVEKGGDLAFIPDSLYAYRDSGEWVRQSRQDEFRWMVFDDRHLYRPDETVSVKGPCASSPRASAATSPGSRRGSSASSGGPPRTPRTTTSPRAPSRCPRPVRSTCSSSSPRPRAWAMPTSCSRPASASPPATTITASRSRSSAAPSSRSAPRSARARTSSAARRPCRSRRATSRAARCPTPR